MNDDIGNALNTQFNTFTDKFNRTTICDNDSTPRINSVCCLSETLGYKVDGYMKYTSSLSVPSMAIASMLSIRVINTILLLWHERKFNNLQEYKFHVHYMLEITWRKTAAESLWILYMSHCEQIELHYKELIVLRCNIGSVCGSTTAPTAARNSIHTVPEAHPVKVLFTFYFQQTNCTNTFSTMCTQERSKHTSHRKHTRLTSSQIHK